MNGLTHALITCRNLKRTYHSATEGDQLELAFPDTEICVGRRYALLGVSGSGKSTFLNLIAGLDRPDPNPKAAPEIVYQFADGNTFDMANARTPFPRGRLGFVFQEGHLVSDASAGINAGLPGLLNGIARPEADLKKYMSALQLPSDTPGREAWRLSGGQKQRVALLRALFHCPEIIFADEPTSSLDGRTAEGIMQLLVRYQEQHPSRTLFWATHDLALAHKFATDFLIVRKPDSGPVELVACGHESLDAIKAKVYAYAGKMDVEVPVIPAGPERTAKPGEAVRTEVPYTEAKVGSSLTFARRASRYSQSQIGHLGRWMGSIEGAGPPVLRGILEIGRLSRRFSDYTVAAVVGLSILMLSFVFLSLWTMSDVRDRAMSDPQACHVVASLRDVQTSGAIAEELTPSLIERINDEAPWRSAVNGWLPQGDINPCGEAADLVFGRNTTTLTLGINRDGQCESVIQPKTLVANLAEPAISAARVYVGGESEPRELGDVVPQAMKKLRITPGMSLTGDEIFVTDGFRELLSKAPGIPSKYPELTSAQLSGLDLCVADNRPLRVGGIISGLPQSRGLPYMALVGTGSLASSQIDTFEQAVFYTHVNNAEKLWGYLLAKGFGFAPDDIRRMIAAGERFRAINALIWIVGGVMLATSFFFLFTSVTAFMEKNAKSNAVLRAYGLTKSNLCRQIFWRLGAISAYSLAIMALVGSSLGIVFYFLFQHADLPLPSVPDIVLIAVSAVAATAVGMVTVVYLSVQLWWRKHESIAQELG